VNRITLQNGAIVLRDGKVGTEQACCCPKCSGPCDEENPCPEGCVCMATVCANYLVIPEEEECPPGFPIDFVSDGERFCENVRTVDSCDDCPEGELCFVTEIESAAIAVAGSIAFGKCVPDNPLP